MDRMFRVNSLVREAIADIISRRLKDPRVGMVSIHEVIVSRDLKSARVYFGVVNLNEIESTTIGLSKAAPFIQKELAKEITLRYTPKLTFIYDDSYERGNRIFNLLKRLKTRNND